MGQPLELAYDWRPPAVVATAALVVFEFLLIRGQVAGWWVVAGLVVVLWAGFVALAYLRGRAYLEVQESRIVLRRFLATHTVEAAELVSVREFLTPRGPSYRLTTRPQSGVLHTVVAPAALLRGGQSTLFGWILARAPQAELDAGSRRTIERLQVRGLLP